MSLGIKLKELRKLGQHSQKEVADYLQVSRQSISKWENDACFPDVNNLIQLSEFFDISVDELVKEKIELTDYKMKVQKNKRQLKNASNLFCGALLLGALFLIIRFRIYLYDHSIYAWTFMVFTIFSLIFLIQGTLGHINKKQQKIFLILAALFIVLTLVSLFMSVILPQRL